MVIHLCLCVCICVSTDINLCAARKLLLLLFHSMAKVIIYNMTVTDMEHQ